MTARDVDIAICGAGPVGSACALFLRERGVAASRIALMDARDRDAALADDRMIAISQGSATLLGRLGAWRDGVAPRATAIEAIHVSHRGHFGQTLIDRRDYGVAALGYVVRHGDLTQALETALQRSDVTVQRPVRVAAVDVSGDDLALTLSRGSDDAHDASRLVTRHVVHAEGGLFDRQQRRAVHRDYGQTAVTAFVTLVDAADGSRARTAYERFTGDGPIALLPANEPDVDGRRRDGYSLVWCGRPDEAVVRVAMDDRVFLDALHDAFGDRLGRFASVGPRRSYPLGLNAVDVPARLRSATAAEFAIGNAAQTLHPVAGQGLNLGLRDAHDLARLLASSRIEHTLVASSLVTRHVASRRADRAATVDLTDLMPRLFASRSKAVSGAAGLTLALLDVARPLRGLFARQMMNGRR